MICPTLLKLVVLFDQGGSRPGPAEDFRGSGAVVWQDVLRAAPHLPPGLLRLAGGEEVVGAVLLPPLARQPRPVSAGPHQGGRGPRAEPGHEADCPPLLSPLIHSLHQASVQQATEEVPLHTGDHQQRPHETRRGRQDWRGAKLGDV